MLPIGPVLTYGLMVLHRIPGTPRHPPSRGLFVFFTKQVAGGVGSVVCFGPLLNGHHHEEVRG